jgi:hypothetical protein
MPVITNDSGDRVTVNLGGIGGDNVTGTVEEKGAGGTFTPVPGARVRIINVTNDQDTTTESDRSGEFDEDLDAATGHKIIIHVEWKDSSGKWHVVMGVVTL